MWAPHDFSSSQIGSPNLDPHLRLEDVNLGPTTPFTNDPDETLFYPTSNFDFPSENDQSFAFEPLGCDSLFFNGESTQSLSLPPPRDFDHEPTVTVGSHHSETQGRPAAPTSSLKGVHRGHKHRRRPEEQNPYTRPPRPTSGFAPHSAPLAPHYTSLDTVSRYADSGSPSSSRGQIRETEEHLPNSLAFLPAGVYTDPTYWSPSASPPVPSPTALPPSAFSDRTDSLINGNYLCALLNLPPGTDVDLWSVSDTPDGTRPSWPLPMLMKLAIHGSERRRLTLQGIYEAIVSRFTWYAEHASDAAWKGSIRHNLSLNKVFIMTPRQVTDPGKGSYWSIDISTGEGNKRERKRVATHRKSNARTSANNEGSDATHSDSDRSLRSVGSARCDSSGRRWSSSSGSTAPTTVSSRGSSVRCEGTLDAVPVSEKPPAPNLSAVASLLDGGDSHEIAIAGGRLRRSHKASSAKRYTPMASKRKHHSA